jgi:hypothetical protein
LTLEELRQRGLADLRATEAVVEFSRDIVHALECPECRTKEEIFAPVGSVKYDEGRCPRDGQMRIVKTIHGYSGGEDLAKRTLDKLGLPLFDVFTVRSGEAERAYLLAGDKRAVLGDEL